MQAEPRAPEERRGYTTCVLPTTASGLVTPNYLSTFRAELHYIYRTSLSTDVNIQRSPAAAYTNNSAYNGQDANSAFIGGQTRCEFCSGNRNDPQCNGWPAQANQTARYTCACSEQTCQQLAQKTREPVSSANPGARDQLLLHHQSVRREKV